MIRSLIIAILSAASLQAFAQEAAVADPEQSPKEEVVSSAHLSSCFKLDEKWGHVPIPGCKVRIRPQWTDKGKDFEFNNFGLRDRDYSPNPDSQTLRILLLGPMFDGIGLSEEETAGRRLEERIRAAGLKNVEVINGTVSGYYAPRAKEFALKLMKDYQPDLIIYYQFGDFFSSDYLESQNLKTQGDQVEKFIPVAEASTPPMMLGWLWPKADTQRLVKSAYRQLKAQWSIHKRSASSEDEANVFLEPSIGAFKKIQSQLSPNQRLLVFYSSRPAENGYSDPNLSGAWKALYDRIVPRLNLPPDLVMRYLRTAGLHVYSMGRGFRAPVQNDLVYEQRPGSLTAQGAHAFAWSAAQWVKLELDSLPKGKDLKMVLQSKTRKPKNGK